MEIENLNTTQIIEGHVSFRLANLNMSQVRSSEKNTVVLASIIKADYKAILI